MSYKKGYKNLEYMDESNIDARLTQAIESSNEVERMAARVMKALVPLMKEIIEAQDVAMLSGFVRGLSSAAASMLLSLPPAPREGFRSALLRDMQRALTEIPHPNERTE